MMKLCRKCDTEKSFKDFPAGRDSNGLYYICKTCVVTRNTAINDAKRPQDRWVDSVISDTKGRATKKGVPFTLTKTHLHALFDTQQCMCAYCKRAFNFHGTRQSHRDSPSVDRLIPTLGYVDTNVVLACHRCNAIKNDATLDELRQLTESLAILLCDITPTANQ